MGTLNHGYSPFSANPPAWMSQADGVPNAAVPNASAQWAVNSNSANGTNDTSSNDPAATQDTYHNKTTADSASQSSLTPWQSIKAAVKGFVSPLTDPFQSTNKFCFTLAMFILHAGIIAATGGAAAPVFLALGAGMALYQAVRGGREFKKAQTPEEKEKAMTSLGASFANILLLGVGAKPALKEAHAGKVELSEGHDLQKSGVFKDTWENFKIIPAAIRKSIDHCRSVDTVRSNTMDFGKRQIKDINETGKNVKDAVQKAHENGNGNWYLTAKNLGTQCLRSLSLTSILRIGGATPN